MKFEIAKNELAKALSVVNKAITAKAPLPILQNVLLESTQEGQLKLMATDLDRYIVTWLDAKIEGEGSTTVPAKALYTFVNGLSDDLIFGDLKGNNLTLKTSKAKATFNGTSPADYPTMDYVLSDNHFVIDSDLLKRTIDETSFSSSAAENSNPEWTGILLKSSADVIHVVGLDGYRLSKKNLSNSDFSKKFENFTEVIIPSKNLLEVLRLASGSVPLKIDVQTDKSTVLFDLDNVLFVSKILDGAFPNYEGAIPASILTSFDVNQIELENAVKLASVFAGDTNAVRFNVYPSEGRLEVLSDSVELGNNKIDIEILEANGDPIQVAFRAKYILDYINNVKSDLMTIKISGQESPAIFIPKGREDYVHVAVPLQPYWEEK